MTIAKVRSFTGRTRNKKLCARAKVSKVERAVRQGETFGGSPSLYPPKREDEKQRCIQNGPAGISEAKPPEHPAQTDL